VKKAQKNQKGKSMNTEHKSNNPGKAKKSSPIPSSRVIGIAGDGLAFFLFLFWRASAGD
jgi:hypothetical protein